jgi:hypothetical protein
MHPVPSSQLQAEPLVPLALRHADEIKELNLKAGLIFSLPSDVGSSRNYYQVVSLQGEGGYGVVLLGSL